VNRRRFIQLAAGAAALAGNLPRGHSRADREGRAFGAKASITVLHEDPAVARRAVDAAFAVLEAVEAALSLYRPESPIRRLNRSGILADPPRELREVLGAALEWHRRSGGAFDPTVQPLWEAHAGDALPGTIEEARRRVDASRIEIRASGIRLGPGQAITLNGIAQGYAADRVREVLRAHGIRHALADTGEFAGMGERPGGGPWRVGIQHPRRADAYVALAALEDRFLATSGDYATRVGSGHHVFDPATGRSAEALESATILAPTGLEADALSTAVFVLGPERGMDLIRSREGVDAFLVLDDGSTLRTPAFPRFG
jgi:thiamine biosynthesis lipoprotein